MKQQRIFSSLKLLTIIGIITGIIASPSPAAASSLSTTTLVSAGLNGNGGNSYSTKTSPRAISTDGRFLVFTSGAINLVPDDDNNRPDVFLYDRVTNKTELITRNINGQPVRDAVGTGPSISADGRTIIYYSGSQTLTNDPPYVTCSGERFCVNLFAYDRITRKTTMINRTQQGFRIPLAPFLDMNNAPVISDDGQFVAFTTDHNYYFEQDKNYSSDVYVHHLPTKTTSLASVGPNDLTGPYPCSRPTISQDGRYVTFLTESKLVAEDTNSWADVYQRDRQLNQTKLISVSHTGEATNGASRWPDMSSNGQYIVFASSANNIIEGDTNNQTDIFLRDLTKNTTRRISVSTKGQQANHTSWEPAISRDGRLIAFASTASNLVRADDNGVIDIFLHYRDYHLTRRINVASHNGPPAKGGHSLSPSIGGNGKAIAFTSYATNLVSTPISPNPSQLYLTYNPVVDIPYYDPTDILDLL